MLSCCHHTTLGLALGLLRQYHYKLDGKCFGSDCRHSGDSCGGVIKLSNEERRGHLVYPPTWTHPSFL